MMKKITTEGLRKLNLIAALLHAAQGVALLVIAKPFYAPVMANFLADNDASAQMQRASHHVFDVNLVWLIAGFLLITALMRAFSATRKRDMYEADIKRGVNRARWAEFALAGSAMICTVGAVVGVFDIATYVLLIGLTCTWCAVAYANEVRVQDNKRFSRLHFWLTYMVGKTIWAALLVYVVANKLYATNSAPVFTITAYGTMLILAIAALYNLYRQSKRLNRGADYLMTERNYILLMMIAQTALAWQIFIGVLR